jgi:hypothetical protein
MALEEHAVRVGEKMNSQVIGIKARRTGTVARPRCGFEYNIQIDLGEIEWGCVDCNGLAHDRGHWSKK